jgi:hypothetical protein
MNEPGLRGLYCLAVAASAATVTDPLVEAASNAGWFGPGQFTDRSTIDVLPLMLVSTLLAATYVFLRARPALASRSLAFARRLRDSIRARPQGHELPLVPAMFALQLGVLYGMETCEQVVVAGHALGGALWLGAPVAIALSLHALGCLGTAVALAKVLNVLTGAAVELALCVRVTLGARTPSSTRVLAATRSAPPRSTADPLASRLGKRAPPFLTA